MLAALCRSQLRQLSKEDGTYVYEEEEVFVTINQLSVIELVSVILCNSFQIDS